MGNGGTEFSSGLSGTCIEGQVSVGSLENVCKDNCTLYACVMIVDIGSVIEFSNPDKDQQVFH